MTTLLAANWFII